MEFQGAVKKKPKTKQKKTIKFWYSVEPTLENIALGRFHFSEFCIYNYLVNKTFVYLFEKSVILSMTSKQPYNSSFMNDQSTTPLPPSPLLVFYG